MPSLLLFVPARHRGLLRATPDSSSLRLDQCDHKRKERCKKILLVCFTLLHTLHTQPAHLPYPKQSLPIGGTMNIWQDESRADIQCCLTSSLTKEVRPFAQDDVLVEARTMASGDRRAFSTSAKSSILPGQVILRNAPLAWVSHHTSNEHHCGACFRVSASKRCSRCQHVWYCSRDCQVSDFLLHRVECREYKRLFDNGNSQEVLENARLLICTLMKLHQQNMEEPCVLNSSGICTCSGGHFRQLEAFTGPLQPPDRATLCLAEEVLRSQSKILDKCGISSIEAITDELESIFRRFPVNNFGIVNEMAQVQASGVYPLAALLNHSCAPNCVLRYTATGVLEVVAVEEIFPHTELCHSYTDLVSTTCTRQERLRHTYGFECNCRRCQGCKVILPRGYLGMGIGLMTWIWETYQQGSTTTLSTSTGTILVELDSLLQPKAELDVVDLSIRVRQLRRESNIAMANDDIQGELSSLSQAVNMILKKSPSSIFSLELYQVHCQRLSSWIVAQESEKALEDCLCVVAVLCLALSQTPNHPLLGLQLFTLGDLYEACGQSEHARKVHLWARQVLTTSMGPASNMVRLLDEKLGETLKTSL